MKIWLHRPQKWGRKWDEKMNQGPHPWRNHLSRILLASKLIINFMATYSVRKLTRSASGVSPIKLRAKTHGYTKRKPISIIFRWRNHTLRINCCTLNNLRCRHRNIARQKPRQGNRGLVSTNSSSWLLTFTRKSERQGNRALVSTNSSSRFWIVRLKIPFFWFTGS